MALVLHCIQWPALVWSAAPERGSPLAPSARAVDHAANNRLIVLSAPSIWTVSSRSLVRQGLLLPQCEIYHTWQEEFLLTNKSNHLFKLSLDLSGLRQEGGGSHEPHSAPAAVTSAAFSGFQDQFYHSAEVALHNMWILHLHTALFWQQTLDLMCDSEQDACC